MMIESTPSYGNRCGHNPLVFRGYERPDTHKHPPPFITKATRRVKRYYFDPSHYLVKLQDINGVQSKQKSERRECVGAVIQVLLQYADLETQRIGTYRQDKSFNPLSISFLVKKTGFGIRRVQRALREIEACGYITIDRTTFESVTGFYQKVEMSFTASLFVDLGLKLTELRMTQHYKRKSRDKAERKVQKRLRKNASVSEIAKADARDITPAQLRLETRLIMKYVAKNMPWDKVKNELVKRGIPPRQ